MKVYVVQQMSQEGGDILGVYATEAAAKQYIKDTQDGICSYDGRFIMGFEVQD